MHSTVQAMDIVDSGSSDSQEEEVHPLSSTSEDYVESDDGHLSSIGSRSEQNIDEPAVLNEQIINEENNPELKGNFNNNNINNEAVNDRLNIEDDIHFGDADNENPRTRYLWENLIFFSQSNLTIKNVISMARGFSLRFGLSLEARLALVNLLKLCAGPDFEKKIDLLFLLSSV